MIEFILNNKIIKTSKKSGITLLDYIREEQQLKGTKIGCREGDCGACTVLVGELKGTEIMYQSITSCISPLGNANGKHIVTIEGINIPKKLNTVQKAMADNFATQCGFCTPGFVVSMTGYALQNDKILNSCNDAVSGNICRCTGYKSIEKAGFEVEEKVALKEGSNQIKWLIDEGFIPNYFETIPNKLKNLKESSIENFNTNTGTLVANGTDLYVRDADKLSEDNVQLITQNKTLNGINISDNKFAIGANTTVTQLLEHEELRNMIPNLKSFIKLISSEQIRNMGTLGGNFVNASPIGDMSIFFLALNSELNIIRTDGIERTISFHQFHTDYKKYDLQKEEIVKSISFPKFKEETYFNFEKVSKRTHLDIASVNTACKITLKNNLITDAHFSVGGVSAIPKYLFETAKFLIGKEINIKNIKEAEGVLQKEIAPISDVRGTETYKRMLARQLFYAHFMTLFPTKNQLQKLIVS